MWNYSHKEAWDLQADSILAFLVVAIKEGLHSMVFSVHKKEF